MKKLYTFIWALFIGLTAYGQSSIQGFALDGDTQESLIGANVYLQEIQLGTITGLDGSFTLSDVPAGNYTFFITYLGYETVQKEITVDGKEAVIDLGNIDVASSAVGLSEVQVVASVAIDRQTPVAVSTIKTAEIENRLGNQEFPEILKSTPSIYTTKSGGGFGDARITVRGFSQENTALLINGIPVNGMEDNKVYWSNWAGLGDVTRTMQIQRGLGASKLAVASVGGTINIITKTTDQEKGGNVFTSIGNDNYRKTGLTLSTGRTDNGWAVTVSGSRTTGDGYIENCYIDAWSYFGSIAKEIGKKQQLLFTVFGAPQKHGQRDFQHPIDDQKFKYGTRWNDDFGYYQGQNFTIRENFYHKPQASLTHIWDLNDKTDWVTSIYGSVGRGGGTGDIGGFVRADSVYREREFRQRKDKYGHQQFDQFALYNQGRANELYDTSLVAMSYVLQGTEDTSRAQIASTSNGLIKRASMNEHEWVGLLSSVNHEISSQITVSGGIDLRWYHGNHYRKTIDLLGADYWFTRNNINQTGDWVDINGDGIKTDDELGKLVRPTNDADRLFGTVDKDQRIDYHSEEDINWYGAFGQVEFTPIADLNAFVSGAINLTTMRRYDFFDKTPEEELTDWFNFGGGNVKVGANYNFDKNNNAFINLGFISRAPYFDALFPENTNDDVNEDAVNEKIMAAEVGYGFRGSNFAANVNAYLTQWQDKTEVSDFSDDDGNIYFLNLLGVDANHQGIELDLNYRPIDRLTFSGYASFNDWQWKNNPNGTVQDEFNNVIADSIIYYIDGLKVGDAAQMTLGAGFDWTLGAGLGIDARLNYFDNLYAAYSPSDRDDPSTSDYPVLELPSYALVDAGVSWGFDFSGLKATARLNVNNLFDKEYIAESFDNYDEENPNRSSESLLEDTRGWYGFGRTWNASLKLHF